QVSFARQRNDTYRARRGVRFSNRRGYNSAESLKVGSQQGFRDCPGKPVRFAVSYEQLTRKKLVWERRMSKILFIGPIRPGTALSASPDREQAAHYKLMTQKEKFWCGREDLNLHELAPAST